MRKVFRTTPEEQFHELCRILRRKVRYVPHDTLEQCVRQLNIKRPYSIKCTDRPEKFLNLTTAEMIATKDRQVLSYVDVLYGDFFPGYFHKTEIESVHTAGFFIKSGPVVALKRSVYKGTHGISQTYTLAIFDIA